LRYAYARFIFAGKHVPTLTGLLISRIVRETLVFPKLFTPGRVVHAGPQARISQWYNGVPAQTSSHNQQPDLKMLLDVPIAVFLKESSAISASCGPPILRETFSIFSL
jgi:hypothetical protein